MPALRTISEGTKKIKRGQRPIGRVKLPSDWIQKKSYIGGKSFYVGPPGMSAQLDHSPTATLRPFVAILDKKFLKRSDGRLQTFGSFESARVALEIAWDVQR